MSSDVSRELQSLLMYLFRTDDQEEDKAEDNASETQKADYIRLALEVGHVRYRYDIADSGKILK